MPSASSRRPAGGYGVPHSQAVEGGGGRPTSLNCKVVQSVDNPSLEASRTRYAQLVDSRTRSTPVVTLTAAEADQHAEAASDNPPTTATKTDDSSNGLAIAALIVGGLGLVAALAALAAAKKSKPATAG